MKIVLFQYFNMYIIGNSNIFKIFFLIFIIISFLIILFYFIL